MDIRKKLLKEQDLGYKEFQCKLMPTVSQDTVIGVRVPVLRKMAKELYLTGDIEPFMQKLPHQYYEENNLHAFLIEQIKDYDSCIEALNCFLPYVDNWATCDGMTPKCLKKETERLLEQIHVWLQSEKTYTVRFGIKLLMNFYLDNQFEPKFLDMVASVKSEEYYVNMMIAWYFATALAKQYDATILYLEQKRLPVWVHNKTIQKAVESYRISEERKRYLRGLKIK